MPEGTKVEEVYKALRRKGFSKERAAKISQAQTGLALETGQPPKSKENCYKNGQDVGIKYLSEKYPNMVKG